MNTREVNVQMGSEVLKKRVERIMDLLEPIEQEMTTFEMMICLQFLLGLVMARVGTVYPIAPLHPAIKAIHQGFQLGTLMNRGDDVDNGK
jgi:hypothetical protein